MTSIYQGLEWDIVVSDDPAERAQLWQELCAAISRHLDEVTNLWYMRPDERLHYINGLSDNSIMRLYPGIHLLARSFTEVPSERNGGFAYWYGRVSRRLGQEACQVRGLRMCKKRRVTLAICQGILRDLELRFEEAKEKDNKFMYR